MLKENKMQDTISGPLFGLGYWIENSSETWVSVLG